MAVVPPLVPTTLPLVDQASLYDHEQQVGTPIRHSTKGKWQRFVSWIWDSDYYEKSDAERKLVFKLDCFMLTAMTLGWWIKNLDQSNLANAYISGMKEDLKITGNQYTYMLSIYAGVVAAMQLPANFLAQSIRPHYFLAASEIGWGVFTFAQAGAKSYQAMYGFRFAIAFFESFYYPVAFFIVGSWYTKRELAKRMSIWFVAGPAGSAFSGYMQAGIYNSMDGLHGLAGWRWLYIVCGILTLPIGFLIFFLVPDFPDNTQVWYLSDDDRLLAKERVLRDGASRGTSKINKAAVFATLKTWRFWLLVPWYTCYSMGAVTARNFGVYLKAYKYSISSRNVLPATGSVVTIVSLILYAYISDRTTKYGRSWLIGIVLIWSIFPNGVLAFWPNSNNLRVAAFLLNGTVYITPTFFSWVAEICHDDTTTRGFVTGAITCFWYTTDAWLPLLIFKQTDGPRFKKGFVTSWTTSLIAALLVPTIHYLHKRDERLRRTREVEQQQIEATSRTESVEDKYVSPQSEI